MKTPLPEMSVIDRHIESNYKIRGYTEAQMIEYGKAEFERGQIDTLSRACVMLGQIHDSFLLSSKPGQLDATQVRTKP